MSPLVGRLHVYSKRHGALTTFESAAWKSPFCLLFIAGLTEGYMGTPYIEKLSTELENRNWSLCQLHMRSSYLGFGTGSLNRDFEDISECISYLHAAGKSHVVLMGHSTGSQNTIHYVLNRLSNQKSSSSPCGVILQACVSDREYLKYKLGHDKWTEYVSRASQMVKTGDGLELVPRQFGKYLGGSPCTAYRFLSLAGPEGDDDFFSSDLDSRRLKDIWGDGAWRDTPVLVIYGELDQYVPDFVDKVDLLQKWQAAYTKNLALPNRIAHKSRFVLLPGANHELCDPTAQTRMISLVTDFLVNLLSPSPSSASGSVL